MIRGSARLGRLSRSSASCDQMSTIGAHIGFASAAATLKSPRAVRELLKVVALRLGESEAAIFAWILDGSAALAVGQAGEPNTALALHQGIDGEPFPSGEFPD